MNMASKDMGQDKGKDAGKDDGGAEVPAVIPAVSTLPFDRNPGRVLLIE